MKIRFIGDVHGNKQAYLQAVGDAEYSVQVGDMGIGFVENPGIDLDPTKHRFIRGNHDDPELCKRQPNYIPDGTYDQNLNIMFVGGAFSVDHHYRTPGFDWWPEEELSFAELTTIAELYEKVRPDVMVTHDCPKSFIDLVVGVNQLVIETRTAWALEEMFKVHQPKLWIFGHYHKTVRTKLGTTDFMCLNINECIDVELPLNSEG